MTEKLWQLQQQVYELQQMLQQQLLLPNEFFHIATMFFMSWYEIACLRKVTWTAGGILLSLGSEPVNTYPANVENMVSS